MMTHMCSGVSVGDTVNATSLGSNLAPHVPAVGIDPTWFIDLCVPVCATGFEGLLVLGNRRHRKCHQDCDKDWKGVLLHGIGFATGKTL